MLIMYLNHAYLQVVSSTDHSLAPSQQKLFLRFSVFGKAVVEQTKLYRGRFFSLILDAKIQSKLPSNLFMIFYTLYSYTTSFYYRKAFDHA